MKKRTILIVLNAVPFLLWIFRFFYALIIFKYVNIDYLNEMALLWFSFLTLFLFFTVPPIFTGLNAYFADTRKDFLLFGLVHGAAQSIGILASGILHYGFISNDSGTALITGYGLWAILLYVLLLTLLFYAIRVIIEKIRRNRRDLPHTGDAEVQAADEEQK